MEQKEFYNFILDQLKSINSTAFAEIEDVRAKLNKQFAKDAPAAAPTPEKTSNPS